MVNISKHVRSTGGPTRAPGRLAALAAAAVVGAALLVACDPLPGALFAVNTTTDGPDASPGDGICEMTVGGGDCSIRAAIDEANVAAPLVPTITIPAGTHVLTTPGTDDTNAGGDLDIDPASGAMIVVGTMPGTIIDANGADHGLDLLSGSEPLFGLAVTGAAGDGIVSHAGANAALSFGSVHANGGAGVRVDAGGASQLWNVTVSGNGAGGIANHGVTTTRFATIAGNTGGGITGDTDGASASVTLSGSVVAQQATGPDCSGPTLSTGFNTDSDGSCLVTTATDTTTAAPGLDPLSNDPLPGHTVAAASPLIDSIPIGQMPCVIGTSTMIDQWANVRPAGGACDRGASEAPPSFLLVDSSLDESDALPGDGQCLSATGACTLRAAIDEANSLPGPDSITILAGINPTMSIAGTDEDSNATGDYDIQGPLTIVGTTSFVDGANVDRVFHHHGPATTLTLQSLVVFRGTLAPGMTGGTLVESDGYIVANYVSFATSSADPSVDTSALHSNGYHSVTLTNSEVVDHDVAAAIHSYATTMVSSVVWDNTGVGIRSPSASITDSMVWLNDLGGIVAPGTDTPFDADIDIRRSTIAFNSSPVAGGGIWVGSTISLFLDDSTVSENTAPDGAAIWVDAGAGASITRSTVADNTGSSAIAGPGSVGFAGAIVDAPASVACAVTSAPSGTFSIISDGSCNLSSGTGVLENTDPLLGPIAPNGGPTLTHLPAFDSPALNILATSSPYCSTLGDTDQRGMVRPLELACDAGSVEVDRSSGGYVVDTAADRIDAVPGDGVCSDSVGECPLRAAIEEANRQSGFDFVTIAPGVLPDIELAGRAEDGNATGDLDITEGLAIIGGNATVDGHGLDRVFDARASAEGVIISNLTITGGDAGAADAGPGALAAVGEVRLDGVTFTDNRGVEAAAVGITGGGGATLNDVVATDNIGGYALRVVGTATRATHLAVHHNTGGGIWSEGSTLNISQSSITGNTATAGAGIHVESGTIQLFEVTVADNIASVDGGGIHAAGFTGMTRSTVSGNRAGGSGGGLNSVSGGMNIETSTFSGNVAPDGAAIRTTGNFAAVLTLVTVTGNVGPPGITATVLSTNMLVIVTTIVHASGATACSSAAYQSHGYNIFSDGSCGITATDSVVADPQLGPLADNGGPTLSHNPGPLSPAVDAIGPATVGPLGIPMCPFIWPTDQRGVARPQNSSCDIGAVERT